MPWELAFAGAVCFLALLFVYVAEHNARGSDRRKQSRKIVHKESKNDDAAR